MFVDKDSAHPAGRAARRWLSASLYAAGTSTPPMTLVVQSITEVGFTM